MAKDPCLISQERVMNSTRLPKTSIRPAPPLLFCVPAWGRQPPTTLRSLHTSTQSCLSPPMCPRSTKNRLHHASASLLSSSKRAWQAQNHPNEPRDASSALPRAHSSSLASDSIYSLAHLAYTAVGRTSASPFAAFGPAPRHTNTQQKPHLSPENVPKALQKPSIPTEKPSKTTKSDGNG